MNKVSRNVFVVLLVLMVFHIFFGIGSIPLLDPDEPVYAETAREMIGFHDFLSPRIFNEFWYDKPPMYYWLVAGAFKIFGVGEFASRFPAALMTVLTVMMVYISATKLFNERVGFWSGMVLGTSMMTFYMGKAAVTDTTLLFCLTGALLCFLHEKYWLIYVFCGLGILVKGPIGIVFPGAIIFLYLLLSGNLDRLGKMHVLPGILLSLLISGPWYYLMYQAHGREFIDVFLGFHNITRFTAPEHPSRVVWWFYLPVIILGMFPWTGLLFQSLKDSICESRTSDLKKLLFFQVWWIFVFIFFTVCQTKLISYILPMFPALAMMIGWNIDRMRRENKGSFISWAVGSGIMFLLLGAVWILGGRELPELAFGGMVLGGITLLLGAAIVISLLLYRDGALGGWLHAGAGILTMVIAFGFLLPLVEDRFTAKYVSESYLARPHHELRTTYVDKFLRPGFMFYAEVPGIELNADNPESIAAVRKDHTPRMAVIRRLFLDKEKARLGMEDWKVAAERGGICLLVSPEPDPAPPVASGTELPPLDPDAPRSAMGMPLPGDLLPQWDEDRATVEDRVFADIRNGLPEFRHRKGLKHAKALDPVEDTEENGKTGTPDKAGNPALNSEQNIAGEAPAATDSGNVVRERAARGNASPERGDAAVAEPSAVKNPAPAGKKAAAPAAKAVKRPAEKTVEQPAEQAAALEGKKN